MKKITKWLKSNLPDEMDEVIRLKSIQWTWLYSIAFLFAWMAYEIYMARKFNTRINSIPLILINSQTFILAISQMLYRLKYTRGEDEEAKERKKQNKITAIAFAATLIVAALAVSHIIIRVTA